MSKMRTFTLYLAKAEVAGFADVFTETAKQRIARGEVVVLESTEIGSKATAYIFDGNMHPPSWLSDLRVAFNDVPNINNKSSCAVVIFSHSARIFMISFAHGWQYIDDSKVESDFGLRVAINLLDDRKVKRIDRSHLGEAIKGVAQSIFQRDLRSFGIDEALDLVRRITGQAEENGFAKNLSGGTSLKITREMTLADLTEISDEALLRFKSDNYKSTGFRIIDKVRPIFDHALRTRLDEQIVDTIRSGLDNFELSMPGWSEDDIVYYKFVGLNGRRRYPDLLMANYREALGDGINNLDVASIVSKHAVLAEYANDAAVEKRWSIKKSLIGSIVVDGGLYAISEGEWYQLDQLFKDEIDAAFRALVRGWESTPLKIIKRVSDDSKRVGFESELEYNRRCAAEYKQICLDQESLTVPSISFGKFEACDLLDIDGRKLIHVKKSSRQSSVLSHFFKQGGNSAKILKTIPNARDTLIDKVRCLTDADTAAALKNNLGESLSGWTIEFHIIDAPRRDGSFSIPFFSRITIQDEARILQGMNFKVSLKFITTAQA